MSGTSGHCHTAPGGLHLGQAGTVIKLPMACMWYKVKLVHCSWWLVSGTSWHCHKANGALHLVLITCICHKLTLFWDYWWLVSGTSWQCYKRLQMAFGTYWHCYQGTDGMYLAYTSTVKGLLVACIRHILTLSQGYQWLASATSGHCYELLMACI